MVTRDSPYLITDIFLHAVVEKEISIPISGLVSIQGDDWQINIKPEVVNGNALGITTTGNVSVARWVLRLVTRQILDFVIIN